MSPRRSRGSVIKYLLLIVAVAVFSVVWLRQRGRSEEMAASVLPPVTVEYPQRGTLTREYGLNGFVETESLVTILPKISGTLISLHADAGDRVAAGTVIGQIDPEPYELTLRQADSAYTATKASWERVERMYNAKAASRDAYDQAKAQFQAAESQYELAKLNYANTRIVTPITGVVLKRHTSQGSLVAPQVPIVTVGDIRNLVVRAKVPERYYRTVSEERDEIRITATVPALDDLSLEARIDSVAPYIDSETRSFETVLRMPGDTNMLRPGMFVTVRFILDHREDAYYLPFGVLVSGRYIWHVEREEGGVRAHRTEYSPDFSSQNHFVVPDEWADRAFIAAGQHFIRDGRQVKVLNDEVFLVWNE